MTNPSTDAAASSELLMGVDIAKVLRSKGPVVSAVVLRCRKDSDDYDDDDDAKKPTAGSAASLLLPDLVDQVQIDTTPKKSEVEKLLGGPFTFLGQYEEEGIMLMVRRGCVLAQEEDDDNDDDHVPSELPPRNPHRLQPPFTDARIHGDIVCMRVAEVDDPLDDDNTKNTAVAKPVDVDSNDEFFLDYTKKEYLTFAARTDVVPPVAPEHAQEDEDIVSDDEEEDAAEWSGEEQGDDDDDDHDDEEPSEEEAQGAMMQLVPGTVLKQFQDQNGREPDEQELAVLKLTVAHKLGAMMGTIPEGEEGEEEKNDSESVQDESSASASTAVASPASSKEASPEALGKRNKDKSAALETAKGEPMAKKIKLDEGATESN